MVSGSNNFYVDPLGNINENISINYIDNYKENKDTTNAKKNDINKKFKSNKYRLVIWSIFTGLLILIFLILLRNINN
jgi:hypothetical protein